MHGAQDLEKEPGFLQTGALGVWQGEPLPLCGAGSSQGLGPCPTSLAGSPPC